MSVKLPPLPFATSALEPSMSKVTLEFHYGKHHKHYVDTVNDLIKNTPYEKLELEEIISSSSHIPDDEKIFNNAAQVWNHNFFWNCLTGDQQKPSKELSQLLEEDFGSVSDFQNQFDEHGQELFGSGWVWLVKGASGNLSIMSTKDAENPLVRDEIPLLTADVWEHAYYLDYQNQREKFLKNIWSIVNWEFVEKNLQKTSPFSGRARDKKTGQIQSQDSIR